MKTMEARIGRNSRKEELTLYESSYVIKNLQQFEYCCEASYTEERRERIRAFGRQRHRPTAVQARSYPGRDVQRFRCRTDSFQV